MIQLSTLPPAGSAPGVRAAGFPFGTVSDFALALADASALPAMPDAAAAPSPVPVLAGSTEPAARQAIAGHGKVLPGIVVPVDCEIGIMLPDTAVPEPEAVTLATAMRIRPAFKPADTAGPALPLPPLDAAPTDLGSPSRIEDEDGADSAPATDLAAMVALPSAPRTTVATLSPVPVTEVPNSPVADQRAGAAVARPDVRSHPRTPVLTAAAVATVTPIPTRDDVVPTSAAVVDTGPSSTSEPTGAPTSGAATGPLPNTPVDIVPVTPPALSPAPAPAGSTSPATTSEARATTSAPLPQSPVASAPLRRTDTLSDAGVTPEASGAPVIPTPRAVAPRSASAAAGAPREEQAATTAPLSPHRPALPAAPVSTPPRPEQPSSTVTSNAASPGATAQVIPQSPGDHVLQRPTQAAPTVAQPDAPPVLPPVATAPAASASSAPAIAPAPVAAVPLARPAVVAPAPTPALIRTPASDRPVDGAPAASVTVTVAALPPAPLPVSQPQPAAQAFAAAMFAAAAPAEPGHDAPTDELPLALAPTGASPAQHLPAVAVAAVSPDQQPTLDLSRDDWMASMIDRIETLRDESGGVRETRMKLAPEALGNLEVSVRRDEAGAIHVRIAADTPQARAMLSEAAPKLAEMAEARGLKLGGSAVDTGTGAGDHGRRDAQATQAPLGRRPASAGGADATDPATDTRLA